MSHKEKVEAIEKGHVDVSIARQAELLGISRSSVYYKAIISEEDIRIMKDIDTLFTERPIYGTRRLKVYLHDCYGWKQLGRERIRRLMHEMRLFPIYPQTRIKTSIPDVQHKKYPYLLRGLSIVVPNQVWGTDITYVRLEQGWAYLVALMDWFSRYVLAWELSPTLETDFCVSALQRALSIGIPKIHNSDQGNQFTSMKYTSLLETNGIKISMDGRGRYLDNIFTERLWRTVKREDIYLRSYHNFKEAQEGISEYFNFYNMRRKHQSLNYQTPAEIYFKQHVLHSPIPKVEIKS